MKIFFSNNSHYHVLFPSIMPDMKRLYNLEVKMAMILFTLVSCLNVIYELDSLQVTQLLLLQ